MFPLLEVYVFYTIRNKLYVFCLFPHEVSVSKVWLCHKGIGHDGPLLWTAAIDLILMKKEQKLRSEFRCKSNELTSIKTSIKNTPILVPMTAGAGRANGRNLKQCCPQSFLCCIYVVLEIEVLKLILLSCVDSLKPSDAIWVHGRVTQYESENLVSIGLDDDLFPGRHQAVIGTSAHLIFDWTLRDIF